MATTDIVNFAITLSGLTLYMHTIIMLRRSIQKCASFQFETYGTYLIGFIFIFVAAMQIVYMVSYQFISNVIVYLTLLNFVNYLVVMLCVFIMLLRTGSGLVLLPHRLNDGTIQYEGYTKENKHLFTFKISFGPQANGLAPVRADSFTSEDTDNNELASRELTSTFVGSLCDANHEKLTEYDATERLLSLQMQFGKLPKSSRSSKVRVSNIAMNNQLLNQDMQGDQASIEHKRKPSVHQPIHVTGISLRSSQSIMAANESADKSSSTIA